MTTQSNPFEKYDRFPLDRLPEETRELVLSVAARWTMPPTAVFLQIMSMLGSCLGAARRIASPSGEQLIANLHVAVVADRHTPRRAAFREIAAPLLAITERAREVKSTHAGPTLVELGKLKRLEWDAALRLEGLRSRALEIIGIERLAAALPLLPSIIFNGWNRAELRALLSQDSGSVWWSALTGLPGREWEGLPKALQSRLCSSFGGLRAPALSLFVVTDPADAFGLTELTRKIPLLFWPLLDEQKPAGDPKQWEGRPVPELDTFINAALMAQFLISPNLLELGDAGHDKMTDFYDELHRADRLAGQKEVTLTSFTSVAMKITVLLKFLGTPIEALVEDAIEMTRHLVWGHIEALRMIHSGRDDRSHPGPVPEEIMLRRIRRLGQQYGKPPTFRELRRTYSRQDKALHEPVLRNLIDSGLVAQKKGKLYLVIEEEKGGARQSDSDMIGREKIAAGAGGS